jgi:competence protein ComEC
MNEGRKFLFLVVAACLNALTGTGKAATAADATTKREDSTRGKLVVTFFDMSGGLRTPERFRHLGLAVMIETPAGKTYFYDTGASVPIDKKSGPVLFDTGRDCIAPLLRAKGIETIDGIVVSHSHADHHGGVEYLLNHFDVRSIIHPVLRLPDELLAEGQKRNKSTVDELFMIENIINAAKGKGVRDDVVTAGDKLRWDDALEIEVLSPPKEFLRSKVSLENANSLILRLRHGKNVFLFMGDALVDTHEHLLKTYTPEQLKATVMSAPHHGYDCHGPFAQVARPDVVVVSCGANNAVDRGGKTKAIFEPIGAKVYVTPWHGTVTVVSDGTSYSINTQRSGEAVSAPSAK